jgi:hypothetical protein
MSDTYVSTIPIPGMTVRVFAPGQPMHDRKAIVLAVADDAPIVHVVLVLGDLDWTTDCDHLYWDPETLVRCLLSWMRAGAEDDPL